MCYFCTSVSKVSFQAHLGRCGSPPRGASYSVPQAHLVQHRSPRVLQGAAYGSFPFSPLRKGRSSTNHIVAKQTLERKEAKVPRPRGRGCVRSSPWSSVVSASSDQGVSQPTARKQGPLGAACFCPRDRRMDLLIYRRKTSLLRQRRLKL